MFLFVTIINTLLLYVVSKVLGVFQLQELNSLTFVLLFHSHMTVKLASKNLTFFQVKNGLHRCIVKLVVLICRIIGSGHRWNLIGSPVPYHCFFTSGRQCFLRSILISFWDDSFFWACVAVLILGESLGSQTCSRLSCMLYNHRKY